MSASSESLAKRALILLGAGEIGAGIARRLAREGAMCGILDPDLARAQNLAVQLASRGGVHAMQVDFQDPETISAAIKQSAKRLGRIDILVTDALPQIVAAPLEAQADSAFAAALESVRAIVKAMQAVLPFMCDNGGGRIIHVGHRYGESISEAIAPYNAAAWSLVGITRTAAVDWGQYQITTNLLLPLAATSEYGDARARRSRLLDLLVSQLPMQRVGELEEDVGGAALFLASDDACFVNGETLYADGGQHIAGPVLNPAKFPKASIEK